MICISFETQGIACSLELLSSCDSLFHKQVYGSAEREYFKTSNTSVHKPISLPLMETHTASTFLYEHMEAKFKCNLIDDQMYVFDQVYCLWDSRHERYSQLWSKCQKSSSLDLHAELRPWCRRLEFWKQAPRIMVGRMMMMVMMMMMMMMKMKHAKMKQNGIVW